MTKGVLKSALGLSKAERILLVERLWDSIVADGGAPALDSAQKAELDRRLDRLERTGPLGADWETVKKRIRRRR